MKHRFTLACPCGLFRQGLDILTAVAMLAGHNLAMLTEDDTYDGLLDDVLAQAEQAVVS